MKYDLPNVYCKKSRQTFSLKVMKATPLLTTGTI